VSKGAKPPGKRCPAFSRPHPGPLRALVRRPTRRFLPLRAICRDTHGAWAAASGWGIVVVALRQQYAGHAAQVLALTAQCPAAAYYTKWIIAVDEDVDPTDFNDVLWALSTRCHPAEDIDVLRNTWSTGLDPSQVEAEARPYGSKVLINACKPHRYLKRFPASTLLRREVYERVAARWAELGFSEPPPHLDVFHRGEDGE